MSNLDDRDTQIWSNIHTLMNSRPKLSIMFTGDNLLEISLARLMIRCGAIVHEIGLPYLDRRYQQEELTF